MNAEKMFIRSFVIMTLLGCFSLEIYEVKGQSPADQQYGLPLAVPLAISGNFDELRPNTFHAGIDCKTMAMVGLNVYAVEDGYVSRIKVDLNGFGRALYIDHPNGTTSVYGHLEAFRDDIDRYCKAEQYKLKQFGVDIMLKPNEILVKKGAFIAWAGNRGASSGPHMHFEIRDTKTQTTLNVFKYTNISIPDTTPPVLEKLWVYPMDWGSVVNNTRNPASFGITTNGTVSTVDVTSPVTAYGNIGIGIQTYDLSSNSLNKIGVYSIELFVDDSLVFEQVVDRLSFDKMRYVNSLIDYGYYMKNGTRINRLFVQPNNLLEVYRNVKNRGIISISDTSVRRIRVRVTDDFSNRSEISFNIKGKIETASPAPLMSGKIMHYNEENSFATGTVKLKIPQGALYDDLLFRYSRLRRLPGYFSDIHQLHDPYTPLHKTCILSVKPVGLPARLTNKALLVSVDPSGKVLWNGGGYKDGFVTANIRSLGNYTVGVDTIPPRLQPLFNQTDFTGWAVMAFTAKDNLSGVSSYAGKIDDQWALFEFDLKQDLLYYRFDPDRMTFGKTHHLDLVVFDEKGNKTTYSTAFYK